MKFAFPKNNIRVTQGFKGDQHPAIDFGGVRIGDKKVWAIGDGVVYNTGVNSKRGNYVEVYHEKEDMTSIYWHLASIDVAKGENTTKNTHIGDEGSTGNSTGPHLHFGLYKGHYKGYTSNYVNPLDYLYAYPEQKLYTGQIGNDISSINQYKDDEQKYDYAKIGIAVVTLITLLKG